MSKKKNQKVVAGISKEGEHFGPIAGWFSPSSEADIFTGEKGIIVKVFRPGIEKPILQIGVAANLLVKAIEVFI